MKEIGKIMVCVDFSEYSKETIEYALAFTRRDTIDILLFNVINIRDIAAVETGSNFCAGQVSAKDYVEKVKALRNEQINEIIEEHFPSDRGRMKMVISIGIPFEEILRAIEAEKVDLVVMANKGRTNLARTLFGSHAEKVFRHSPVPVLSVRNRAQFSRNS